MGIREYVKRILKENKVVMKRSTSAPKYNEEKLRC